jgi:hypothetical protein
MLKREGKCIRKKTKDCRRSSERGEVRGVGSNVGEGCVAYNDKGMQSTTKHIN